MDPTDDLDQARLGRIEEDLADVERALERLDEGSYATCEACGRAIGADALAAAPTTRRCAEHPPAPLSASPAASVSAPEGPTPEW